MGGAAEAVPEEALPGPAQAELAGLARRASEHVLQRDGNSEVFKMGFDHRARGPVNRGLDTLGYLVLLLKGC